MTSDAPHSRKTLSDDQKRILQVLGAEGPLSRIALSRRLSLNGTAVTRAGQTLLNLGLIEEAGAQRASRGRPSLPLQVRPLGAHAIGAALQPGWVDVALVDLTGRSVRQGGFAFDDGAPEHFARALSAEAARLVAPFAPPPSTFVGYGVSVPGFIGLEPGRRHTVERLKAWRDVDLSAVIGEAMAAPVWIENDANAAALAEFYAGGRSGEAMLVFYLGHGVGGAAVLHGDLFRGAFGNAGEVGLLYPLGLPRPSAVDLAAHLGDGGGASLTSEAMAGLPALSDARPDAATEWSDRAAAQLEAAILSGVAWLDPEVIVLSGALPHGVLTRMRDRLDKADWRSRLAGRRQPQLVVSDLGSFAGAIGAGLLPIHDLVGG